MENDEILHKHLDDLDEDRESGTLWLNFPQAKQFGKKNPRTKVWGKRILCSCEIASGDHSNLGNMSMNTSKTRTIEQVCSLVIVIRHSHYNQCLAL